MRISLLCVGRLSREYKPVAGHYLRLLNPYASIEVVEVPEVPLSRGHAAVVPAEGAALLRRLRTDGYRVALDRGGRELSSEELSELLAGRKLHGVSDFQFILGGALGLDSRVLETVDFAWSLSKLTFPHQLARCVVLEQLYRAVRIERGEPYHH